MNANAPFNANVPLNANAPLGQWWVERIFHADMRDYFCDGTLLDIFFHRTLPDAGAHALSGLALVQQLLLFTVCKHGRQVGDRQSK